MPRWLRMLRGMIGTGVAFAGVTGIVFGSIGLVGWMMGKWPILAPLLGGRMLAAAFLLGVGFSGFLAIAARGRTLEKISIKLVTALGAAAGFVYWLALAFGADAIHRWEGGAALVNFLLLTILGAGAAATTLIVARKAGRSLAAGDAPLEIGDGVAEEHFSQAQSKDRVR